MLRRVENGRNRNCIMAVGTEADKKDVGVSLLRVVISLIRREVKKHEEGFVGN